MKYLNYINDDIAENKKIYRNLENIKHNDYYTGVYKTDYIHTLVKEDFTYNENINIINKVKTLANECKEFLETHDLNNEYEVFKIPKATTGVRTITAPKPELKNLQRKILKLFSEYMNVRPHNAAKAYVKNGNIKKALLEHLYNKSRWFLKLDIKDFFGSLNKKFVFTQINKVYPISYIGTDLLHCMLDICFLDDSLPQGAPTSPFISNLVMVEFDYQLSQWLGNQYVYTRYADDLLITSRIKFTYKPIIKYIESLFKDTPLKLKYSKTRYSSCNGRNWNLGIMYNKDLQLTVGHKKHQELKNKLYAMCQFSLSKEEIQKYQGEVAFARMVRGKKYLQNHVNRLINRFGVDPLKL